MQRGSLSGLAGIAACAAYVSPLCAFAIGVIISSICYCCMYMKEFFPSAYSREIWIPHGIGGLVGTVLLGVFVDADFFAMSYVHGKQLIVQVGGSYAVVVIAFVVTWLILLVISRMIPAYVAEDEEQSIAKQIMEERKKMFGEAKEA